MRIESSTCASRITARGPSIRCARLTKVLLGTLLVLSLLSLGSNPIAAELTSADQPTPDFRFRQPWVTLGIRGGYVFNRANGEIYTFLTEKLTLDSEDFNAGAFQFDVAVRALTWLDVVFGFEYNYSSTRSEFRDFKEAITDAPIKQDTKLSQVPLTTSLKLYPLGRGRRVGEYAWIRSTLVPYVGGGLGATWYRLEQDGDFVDESDCTPLGCVIFSDKLSTSAWAFSKHVFAGLDLKLSRNFGLVVEGRYQWARATVKRDYVGFERINLDGARVTVGFSFRI